MNANLPRRPEPFRLAAVSYFNSKPLIDGLEGDPQVKLELDVPAKLIDRLRAGESDVALLPVIDYQRMDGLVIVPAGGICCDGPTLTVRIFSRKPIAQIKHLAADTESHTSVVLAKIILAESYGVHPEFIPLARDSAALQRIDAQLLIGDKVICDAPMGFDHQLDLGQGWKELTDLPFVFAAWTARAGLVLEGLSASLEAAKKRGLGHVDELVQRFAAPAGWPVDIARKYLLDYLKFDIGLAQIEAIKKFHEKAARHNLIDLPLKPLVFGS